MTADRDAFLRAIVDAPDDDVPRLVFADWLDEHGDPALAGFIRDQITLEHMDEADAAYPETLARMRRRGVFTRKERTAWIDAVPSGVASFRRGLIDSVRINPATHLAQPTEEWERVPLSQLWWETQSQWWSNADFLARPELRRVNTLALSGWQQHVVTPILLAGKRLDHLRALRVATGNVDTDDPWRIDLPSLDSLHVRDRWPPRAWAPLTLGCHKSLRRLHLAMWTSHDEWESEYDLDWFSETRHRRLEYGVACVDVDGWRYGNRSACQALAADHAVTFRENIEHVRPADLDWQRLRHLHAEAREEPQDIGWLSHHPQSGCLQSIALAGVRDVEKFAAGDALTGLRRLEFADAFPPLPLGGCAPVLLTGSYCPRLLRLGWSGFHRWDLRPLLAATLPELRWLTVRGVWTAEQIEPLATAEGWPNLTTLHFPGCADTPLEDLMPVWHRLASGRFPHLSLISVGVDLQFRAWVVSNGRLEPVADGVDPLCEDWFVDDPTDRWF